MADLKYKFARTVVHLRIYVILICIILSAFFISVLKDITVETRLEDFIPQKHPFVQVQHRLTDIFGGLNQVSLALEVKKGDIFNKEFLEKVVSLTEDLYLLKDVNISRVNSIASRHIKHVTANEEGFFVERLLRLPPETPREMEGLKQKVISNPNVYGKMVSKDLKSTLIQVDFESQARTSYIFDSLKKLQEKYEDKNTKMYIAGRPILEGWLNFYLPRMFKILILSFIVISVVLYLTFRSKRGVILPLLDSSMATLWGMGAMKLMGLRLDPSTILVPFIILSLGISHSIHSLKRYYEEMRIPKMKSKHAVVNTISHLLIPGLACVLTDGFGFLSLTLVPLPTIKSMAMASGFGILANFFTSFMFTPCVLSFMRKPRILEIEKEEKHKLVDIWLAKLGVFSLSKRAGTIVVVIFMSVCLVSLFGISKIVVGDNTEGSSYLYPHSPYNQSESFINKNFGGTNSYYLFAESGSSLLNANALNAMDSLQAYLAQNVPQVGSSVSVANSMKALNMFMFAGKHEYFKVPDKDDAIAQYWFLYTVSGFPSDYDHLISPDERFANIKFDFKDHKSSTVELAVQKTREFFDKHKFQGINFYYGGGDIGILYAVNDIIKRSMVPNILFVSLLIFLYVSFVYRSAVAGWMLLLPLIFSNLFVFSLFGFLGTSITTETLPLACLSEGLGINYGIYILARLHDEIKEKKRTYKNILHYTLVTSGKAVFFSGFIVSLGIFIWVFSSILLQVRLGLNLCLALILNMITSLVMIPVLAWWIKPRFLFKRVRARRTKTRRRGMRSALIFLAAVCLSLTFFGQAVAQAQGLEYGKLYSVKEGMSADDIMRIVYHNKYSFFAQDYNLPKTSILYVAKDGFTRTKEAIRQRIVKNGEAGISYKDIVLVTYPTQAKGLAVLTWTYEDAQRDQDTWLWIPALKKVRKVSASESDDAFMGSDFTVEEVSTRAFEDETYTLVGTKEFPGYTFEHTGEVLFKGTPCFVIEAVPNKPHWYYSKRIVWVDKKTGGNILDEYYDKNGELFKTLFREWTIYKPGVKDYPRQQRLECKDLRTGHRTVILNENEEYDVGLDENLFSEKRLERMQW